MTTVNEFYNQFEEVEKGLIEMTASPILAISHPAERKLKNIYQLKKELEDMDFEPSRKIKGIRTTCFGIVSFEDIKKFIEDYGIISSQKYLLKNGAKFSEKYMKENGLQ
jgi:hypothetical protein